MQSLFSLIYAVLQLEKSQVNLELRHLPEGAWPSSGCRVPVFSSTPPRSSLPHCGVDHGCVSLHLSLLFSLLTCLLGTRCDSVKLDGTNKPSTDERGSYGHAQKMRAAMTYAFGRLQGLGNLPWHESELHSGQMLGNPSVSVEVSSYMCSLRRRKVRSFTNVQNVLDTFACCSLGSGG